MMNGKPRGKRCGFLRVSRAAGERSQREMLERNDVHPIYNAKDVDLADVAKSLRPGDELWVTTLGRLASNRRDLSHAIDAIHNQKAIIVEAASERRSDKAAQVAQMVMDAVQEITQDARALSPAKARKFGSLGGQITRLRVRRAMEAQRLPKAEARNVWLNPRLTTAEALEQMTGWTQASAYRHLKTRKLAKGRPRKNDKPE